MPQLSTCAKIIFQGWNVLLLFLALHSVSNHCHFLYFTSLAFGGSRILSTDAAPDPCLMIMSWHDGTRKFIKKLFHTSWLQRVTYFFNNLHMVFINVALMVFIMPSSLWKRASKMVDTILLSRGRDHQSIFSILGKFWHKGMVSLEQSQAHKVKLGEKGPAGH